LNINTRIKRAFLAGCLLLTQLAPGLASDRNLRVAWFDQPPYQYQEVSGKSERPSGVDLEILRQAAERAGLSVTLRYHDFAHALELLAAGEVDLVAGAYDTPQRRTYAEVSPAFRRNIDRAFLYKHLDLPRVDSPAELGKGLAARGIRLAVVKSFDWGAETTAMIEALKAEGLVVFTNSLPASVSAVLDGRAQGFIGDQLSGMALLAAWGSQELAPYPLILQQRPVHMLFSKTSIPPWQRERFSAALAGMHRDGSIERIVQRFTNPLSIRLLLTSQWVEGLFLVGIVAFSISGVMIARQGDYSIFGAFVLASLPALGGGVVRDILLLRKLYFFESPEMIYTCMATIFAGYMLNRFLGLVRGRALWFFDIMVFLVRLKKRINPRLTLELFDAIGLALFTVVAVSITAEEGLMPLWFWGPLIGALSATGGAIIRDMIRSEAHNPMLHTSFYAETAVLWGIVLALFLQFAGPYAATDHVLGAVLICVLGIVITRMAFVILRIPSPKY
jgi:polar amino acid transport system substrate-binding protein